MEQGKPDKKETQRGAVSTVDRVVRALVSAARRTAWLRPFRRVLLHVYNFFARRQQGRSLVTTIQGVTYDLDLGELIDSTLFYVQAWEPSSTERIREQVWEDMVALDVGANMGYFSLLLAQQVGVGGRVIAFEPTRWAYEKLARNLSLNRFPQIQVERLALSDSAGVRMVDPSERAFQASWSLSGRVTRGQTEEMAFVTLDQYVAEEGLERVHFVKIDVDGYELRVVRGGMETLRRDHPTLLIEVSRLTMERIGDDPDELLQILDELGYVLTDDRNHVPRDISELRSWANGEGRNLLCVHRPRILGN